MERPVQGLDLEMDGLAEDGNSGKVFQIPKKIWNFSSVKTAFYILYFVLNCFLFVRRNVRVFFSPEVDTFPVDLKKG